MADFENCEDGRDRSVSFPEANPNPVLSSNPEGKPQFINTAALRLLQDLQLDNIEDILPANHKALVRACLETRQSLNERCKTAGHTIVWSYTPVESENLIYIYGHDVSEYCGENQVANDLPLLHAVLDKLVTPILIVDRELRLNFVNNAAEHFMAEAGGLLIKNGSLCGPLSAVTNRLKAIVESIRDNATALTIPRFFDEGVYEVLISPLCAEKDHGESSLLMIYLFDPSAALGVFNDILASLYGLTPAEVKLTERLVQGDTLQEAVDELGIAMSTARSQLKYVFRKTGTTHQSELIRRIIMGPAGQVRLQ